MTSFEWQEPSFDNSSIIAARAQRSRFPVNTQFGRPSFKLPNAQGHPDEFDPYADDAVVITDFKTARSRWSQSQADQSSEQLLLYSMMY